MSRTTSLGMKAFFATTVADIDAPTVAEINAAVDLSPYGVADFVTVPSGQARVDAAGVNDTYDVQRMGTKSGELSVHLFRDDDDETDSYDLVESFTEGFLIVSRFGAPIAGSKVEVYPIEWGDPQLETPARNEMQKFTAPAAVTSDPSIRAVVAA